MLLPSTNFQQPVTTFEQLYGLELLLAAVLSCGLYSVISREIAMENVGDTLVLVAGQQMTGMLWIGMMMLFARGAQIQDVANLS